MASTTTNASSRKASSRKASATTRGPRKRTAGPRKRTAADKPKALVGPVAPTETETNAENITAKAEAAAETEADKDRNEFVTAVRAAQGIDKAEIHGAADGEDPAAFLYGEVHKADSAADLARETGVAADGATKALAREVLRIRSLIRLNGTPDWGATKRTAKAAVSPLIDKARKPYEERETTRDRINKAAQFLLPYFVAEYVNETDGLGLSAEDLKDAAESTSGTSDKPAVQDLINRMGVQYRDDAELPKNAPRSPWRKARERAEAEGNAGPNHRAETKADKSAREAREAAEAFAALRSVHLAHLTSPSIVGGLFGIAADWYKVLASARPRLGGTNREDLASDLYSLGRLFTVAGEVLHAGGIDNLSAASKADLVAALAKAAQFDKAETETDKPKAA